MTVHKPTEPVRLTTSGPADLLELVPYLLGFRPEESLVLVVIRERRVALTARVDIPPAGAADELLERFGQIASSNDASALVLFAFSESRVRISALMADLIEGLRMYSLMDAIYADGSRWWSLMCSQDCCPEDGTRYQPGTSRLAAEAVYAGLSTCSSRAEVAASVAGPPACEQTQLRELLEAETVQVRTFSRVRRRREAVETVDRFLARPYGLSESECARLSVLVADLEVRDAAWSMMTRAAADDHVNLWRQVVARTVSPMESAPLCLLGMAAWISGNGALMVCCLERMTTVDPGYTMAGLLEDINRRGLPPTAWDSLVDSMRAEIGPLVG
ncbi:MAG TPA: DUF4192 domain-containing protein [Propionibacteriaceae bacterium]|nr:DUF4192 domain-containing protein [Propionibacteriaceae bacterium]